jgi:hypothetical protein
MESNSVIVEALKLLLEKRQQEHAVAKRARSAAEEALAAAVQAEQQARQLVDDVFQMLSQHTTGLRGDREIGSVWRKTVEGPQVSFVSVTDPVVVSGDFHRLGGSGAHTFITRVADPDQEQQQRNRRNRLWKSEVIEKLVSKLSDGRRATALELHAALEADGVDFRGIFNPVHRIVQIMSADSRFEANRAEGWGLVDQANGTNNDNDSASPPDSVEDL